MKTLGLFPNQKEADEAVDALAKADLGDHDIRVLSEWTDDLTEQLNVMPVSNPTSALSGVAGPRRQAADEILDETSKGEAVEFLSVVCRKVDWSLPLMYPATAIKNARKASLRNRMRLL